jgi:hypothetical protein
MLRIEVDTFSGRPNPVWMITDSQVTKKLLADIAEDPAAVAKQGTGFSGLGFRELRVDVLHDDEPKGRGVPKQFALASTAAKDLKRSGALAQRLIEALPVRSEITLVEHSITPLDAKLREMLLARLAKYLLDPPRPRPPRGPKPPPPNPLRTTIPDAKCDQCQYEVSQFNPAFWNNAASVWPNNCYNYARNWRTNTFAQPGRAHGAQTGTMSCGAVTTAAMADGLVKRCHCLPISEWPRRLMALVIDPGNDYHWYRHQRGGFWGHKPGHTAAKNIDNSNVIITNPETCNRGGYTDFCGYFYAGVSVVIN